MPKSSEGRDALGKAGEVWLMVVVLACSGVKCAGAISVLPPDRLGLSAACTAGADPLVHLRQFELPEAADPMRG